MLFLNQLINGLHLGSIYALIALGYTMVYGIVKLINFAHGDILMIGAYTSLIMITSLNQSPFLALIASVLVCTAVGVAIEAVAYKPLRNSPRISALITAIGMSYLIENIAQLIYGAEPRPFPNVINNVPIISGEINLGFLTLLTIVSSAIILYITRTIVFKTKTGKAMRAVSEDLLAARLMGVNVNKTISITFALGSALAGFGAFLYSAAYPTVTPFMGFNPGLKAFIAAVLGGIGMLEGAMLGGFIMGVVEAFSKAFISSQLADAIVYGILIIVLLVRPSGILGKPMIEKV
ncbi:branched-chain amino acid ABC transporter permease [Anaerococcus sp.]|uniref:branched-chain amino acid ABC transporter permease n=1 Tax=Anaerococcus sp. TaxID=1872515 RepID=UPI002A91BE79|nr:branched-chain amino acid ABC transporter permease [Anaerococcus sp.]MDY6127494.1 branched-chain amino acid ABC transporter permease [Anaerococcus sp.]